MMLAFGIIAMIAMTVSAQTITPQVAVAKRQEMEENRHVWHTRTFRIDSDQALESAQLETLARVADTTATAVRTYPLPLFHPPRSDRPRIALHHDQNSYQAAGANPETAGTYDGRNEVVLIHTPYLFRKSSIQRRGAPIDEDLIVHELVHLCMHRLQTRLPQWLSEGIAEYFAVAHRGSGTFEFEGFDRKIGPTIRGRLGIEEDAISLCSIADIAPLSGRDWIRLQNNLPASRKYETYAVALLLTHYYLNGTPARREQVKNALENRRSAASAFPELQAESEGLQGKLVTYWRTRGLELHFRDPDPLPRKPEDR